MLVSALGAVGGDHAGLAVRGVTCKAVDSRADVREVDHLAVLGARRVRNEHGVRPGDELRAQEEAGQQHAPARACARGAPCRRFSSESAHRGANLAARARGVKAVSPTLRRSCNVEIGRFANPISLELTKTERDQPLFAALDRWPDRRREAWEPAGPRRHGTAPAT